jgi:hypothetical protein
VGEPERFVLDSNLGHWPGRERGDDSSPSGTLMAATEIACDEKVLDNYSPILKP